MRRVFADTGYWVALLNPRDELHQKARELPKAMGLLYIFTSEMVLAEVLNDFSKQRLLLTISTSSKLVLLLYCGIERQMKVKERSLFNRNWE